MRSKNQQTLEKEVLQQLIGEESDDGMPVILAKRIDPSIPNTCNLRDYGFEGLIEKGTDINGKLVWEPHRNFVLIIDGESGNCRIPDTKNNRERLKRLSKVEKRPITRVVLNEATGKTESVEESEIVPATYTLMEQNLAQSSMVDVIAKRVYEMMNVGKNPDEEVAPARRGRKPNPDNLLEPIR